MKHWSIRMKMTLFFAAALIVIVLATFLTMRLISASVLRATARKYLLESVNANADEVLYIRSMAQARDTIGGDIFIEYDGGYLEIDDDFLDIINDVHTALYTGDGTLLYGTNPLARQMDGQAFADNAMRRLRVNGIQYEIYERKMTIEGTDALWLRGVMPMTERTAARYHARGIGAVAGTDPACGDRFLSADRQDADTAQEYRKDGGGDLRRYGFETPHCARGTGRRGTPSCGHL